MSNKDCIGSLIEVSVNNSSQHRYTLCGEGYIAQNSLTEFFGLAQNTEVDYVKVTWLSGIEDYFYNIQANQVFNIIEGNGTLSINSLNKQSTSVFPNPVKDKLILKSKKQITKVQIISQLGEIVFSMSSINDETVEIYDLNKHESGINFLKVFFDTDTYIHKFIKD
ncbi:ASPIC/UnbV domain-containing protein [Ichthyenterobacterium magnum]|uniref:Putative secreted protein (Por secretion system target) n=1 Tax=Ichthyenterobacterium magnum TaxID=1230530 RepID=A0A420DLL7_9FLAO|nr:ASPIC/UnbV domain-containing protein [Ichthyenterobacterium magnum]RKE95085.1 putative secreted protein (Por secretion system target) [Ichthyenterobacterium magnum]